ncbi:MAG: DUF4907 domain-containing protein [Bacteroidetes bacterium]|nr:DUF4907 domain-containing protein [Bacteroidota bacterium]
MNRFPLLLLGIALAGCNRPQLDNGHSSCMDSIVESKVPKVVADSNTSHFSASTYKNKSGDGPEGFGFDIFQDGKMMIHQNSIPAIQGNKAFATEEDAKAVGALMLYKVSKGIMPPTISVEDLDSLGVKY